MWLFSQQFSIVMKIRIERYVQLWYCISNILPSQASVWAPSSSFVLTIFLTGVCFRPWLRASLCRKWCRNGWTVGMAETEEEALRWKVHLKGFGNNPLKLPQGIRWNGLHLDSPLCHSLGAHLLRGGRKKRCVAVGCFLVILCSEFCFWYCELFQFSRWCSLSSPSLRGLLSEFAPFGRRRRWHGRSKDHWFCISLISCSSHARILLRNSCCFSPLYFSCHFDFIMQDLCWVHNPLKWEKGL